MSTGGPIIYDIRMLPKDEAPQRTDASILNILWLYIAYKMFGKKH